MPLLHRTEACFTTYIVKHYPMANTLSTNLGNDHVLYVYIP
jgi:hypothetical protein